MVEFTEAKTEQRRAALQQEIANIELQEAGRERDLEMWRLYRQTDLSAASEEGDDRIVNNRDDECRQQIAMAITDLTKVDIKLKLLRRDLASLGKQASAPKAPPTSVGDV